MKLSQFNFDLPADRIAQEPTRWRDEARLMALHKDTGDIEHRLFKDIIDYFGKGDTFVLNDTKVFPCLHRLQEPHGGLHPLRGVWRLYRKL